MITRTIAVLSLGVLMTACASAPPAPVNIENTIEVMATVEKIDLERRLVALKGASGEVFTVEVGPEVRNLPQVRVGDRVVARYYEAIGASLRTADATGGATIELDSATARPGERPAGVVGTRATVPVTIVSVDSRRNVVSFYGEDGLVRALTIRNPDAQAFVRRLNAGDRVDVTFTEAVAVSVEPAP
jgi:hypothetical protein